MKMMVNESEIDALFHALAHPIRRQIIDRVAESPGISNGEISCQFDVSRIAISKHIKILEEVNLLIVENEGRQRLHYFNVIPIQTMYERWTNEYSQFFAKKIHQFKLSIEQEDEGSDEKTA